MKILLIDDDHDDQTLFCEAVNQISNSVVCETADSGQKGLALLESSAELPDILFLDINMPMMDGQACLREIKANAKLKDIPVVMYSTTNNSAEISKYKMMGAKFLVKPPQFSKLVKSLSFILGYSDERSDHFFAFSLTF